MGGQSTSGCCSISESASSSAVQLKASEGAASPSQQQTFPRRRSKGVAETPTDENSKGFGPKDKGKAGKKGAGGAQNLLVAALLTDFQESLRSRFKTRKQAFEQLGGADDCRIDEAELQSWLKTHGFTNRNLNKQLFLMLDVDRNKSISRSEFKALFDGDNEDLDDFKLLLRETFKSRKDAFERLGGKDDGNIDLGEFKEFVRVNMRIDDDRKIINLFNTIDDNKNDVISHAEFKALFQPDGEIAKVVEFKEDIRNKFRSRNAAFEKLGGSDDGLIDREEFQRFMERHVGYSNVDLVDQLFTILDDDNSGHVSKSEFEALFMSQTSRAVTLKDSLKTKLQEKCRSRQQAFDWLGGKDDHKVDHAEFHEFMKSELGNDNLQENDEVFRWMDTDNSGFVTLGEFKKFF